MDVARTNLKKPLDIAGTRESVLCASRTNLKELLDGAGTRVIAVCTVHQELT